MNTLPIFGTTLENSEFEKWSKSNGGTYWNASDLAKLLGYETPAAFHKVILKAKKACLSVGIDTESHFHQVTGEDGKPDIHLTRFACYLTAMNADSRKPQVAMAQAYFATLAESVRQFVEEAENVQRAELREELTDRNKSMTQVAHVAGVETWAFFHNAGYLGMYNMGITQLRELRSIPSSRSPLDFMGKSEMAANLFRMTQTEEKIEAEQLTGQTECQAAARTVGKAVRKTMIELSGRAPETLPKATDIRDVRRDIKSTQRKLTKIDRPARRKEIGE